MNKKYIIVGLVLILVIVTIPLSLLFMKKKDNKELSIINHKKVEGLYVKNDDICTDIPSDENVGLFLIFGQMKKNNLLGDSIDLSTYRSEAKKIVKEVNENINYTYEGYKYTRNGDKILRTKSSCESNYVSKLYGYSQGEDNLYLTIVSGYVKDDKVYDLDGNEIGDYSKGTLKKVLDKGTMKYYVYGKVGNSYKFEKVED